MNKLIVIPLMLSISTAAFAQKTYTPSQLNRMGNSGQYPSQGPVNNTQTQSMTFDACKANAERVMSQIRGSYPVRTVVDTGILYTVKAWTNNGAITVSCSELDREMILTQASYN